MSGKKLRQALLLGTRGLRTPQPHLKLLPPVKPKISAAKKRNRDYIRRAKNKPCVDCGDKFHFAVMEFDHVPSRGEKKFNISQALSGTIPLAVLQAEIAKCDVLCSNCHKLREYRRNGGRD